jgi:hypothetical protein
MQPIDRKEVLPLAAYEEVRPHFRQRVIQAKKSRRVPFGDLMTVVFENRDTMLLQIQEMLRTERITQESGILHEIETYNDLVPGTNQLSMTLTIEIADREQREAWLTKLAGLESKVVLVVGDERCRGQADDRSVEGIARTTAVHYFKFDLSESAAKQLLGGAPVRLESEHPEYPVTAPFPQEVAAELRADLSAP